MVRYRDTLWCDGCGVEIRWKPLQKGRLYYCCQRCLAGEVCECEEVLEDYPQAENSSSSAASAPRLSIPYSS